MEKETPVLHEVDFEVSDIFKTEDLSNGTNVTGHSLLHWSVQNGNIDLCKQIILKGYKIDKKDNFGCTPLMLASLNGHLDIVKLLLNSGADSFITNYYGADSLAMACAGDHVDIVGILSCIRGKPIEEEEKDDYSWPQNPVIISAACGSINCVRFLCERSKECVHLTNKISGLNALMLAETGTFKETIDILLSYGAERIHEIKQFYENNANLSLVSSNQNLSLMFSLKPEYTHCCSHKSPGCSIKPPPVFIFPSTELDCVTPAVLTEAGSPCSFHVQSFNDDFYPGHPLTPNLCFSPKKKPPSQIQINAEKKNKPLYAWFKKLKRKRSKSMENLTKVKRSKSSDIDHDSILDYILSTANLSEYRSHFRDQELTFRTFLTLNEDELIEVGIKKPKVRQKILKLIKHYKRIFSSQN